jgi:hypothetical protein
MRLLTYRFTVNFSLGYSAVRIYRIWCPDSMNSPDMHVMRAENG